MSKTLPRSQDQLEKSIKYFSHMNPVDIKSTFAHIRNQQNLSIIRDIFKDKEEMIPIFTDWLNRKIGSEEANKKMLGNLPSISSRIIKEILEL